MGVTIHYAGRFSPESFRALTNLVRAEADRLGWRWEEVERDVKPGKLRSMWTKSEKRPHLAVHPHENCEPLEFDPGYDWSVDTFVKTSFAPVETHMAVAALLKQISDSIIRLDIEDEGEFYPTDDIGALEKARQAFFDAFDAQLAKGAVGPMRLDSGRIVDCYFPKN